MLISLQYLNQVGRRLNFHRTRDFARGLHPKKGEKRSVFGAQKRPEGARARNWESEKMLLEFNCFQRTHTSIFARRSKSKDRFLGPTGTADLESRNLAPDTDCGIS